MPRRNNNTGLRKYIGDLSVDDRGVVRFVNDFDFKDVKRFYQAENFEKDTIRAFHGHKNQGIYVFVSSGSIILCAVPLDNLENPSRFVKVERYILSDRKPQIIYVPPMYANGFKSLEASTKVMFFSTVSIEETKLDDFRYPYDFWGMHIWEIENR